MDSVQFAKRLEEHRPFLRAFCRRRGFADADDLVQRAIIRGWLNRDKYLEQGQLRHWLTTICRNLAVSASLFPRQHPHVPFNVAWHGAATVHRFGPDLDEMTLAAIDAIPLCFREVFILAEICEHAYKQIAHELDIQMGTVMSRLYRARRLFGRAYRRLAASEGLTPHEILEAA